MYKIFPIAVSILFILIHYLVYTRMLSKLSKSKKIQKFFRFFLYINTLGIISYMGSRYLFSPPKELYFILSLSIGVGFVLFVSWIGYEFLHQLQKRVPFSNKKREFFKKSSDLGFVALGGAYMGGAINDGLKEPIIKNIKLGQKLFTSHYRIAQISDMHIGGLIDREFVAKSVELINSQNPDIVVITGDLVDAKITQISDAVYELKNLKSKFGTFYVSGNHEYFHEIIPTLDYLKTLGIRVLENESVLIDDSFYIIGVHDLFGYRVNHHEPDLTKAIINNNPNIPSLLLAHQPKFIKYLGNFKPNLMLSGHTHGGQLWPFNFLVKLEQPFVKGLHKIGKNSYIYVNSGIGFWGPPMRLGSSAEIAIIDWS